jgi:hypothetical protein
VDDGVVSEYQIGEFAVEQICLNQLKPGRKSAGRRTTRDRTDAVTARDQARDERATEDARRSRDKDPHGDARMPKCRFLSAPLSCKSASKQLGHQPVKLGRPPDVDAPFCHRSGHL